MDIKVPMILAWPLVTRQSSFVVLKQSNWINIPCHEKEWWIIPGFLNRFTKVFLQFYFARTGGKKNPNKHIGNWSFSTNLSFVWIDGEKWSFLHIYPGRSSSIIFTFGLLWASLYELVDIDHHWSFQPLTNSAAGPV